MFKIQSNEKIGLYISKLINKKFKSTRQFCIAYIEAEGREANQEEIQKMSNRLSQIKKGAKSIQIYDLQYFTKLLDVTCEEILSAGNSFVPNESRLTNYKIAFTKDKNIWEQYINREDKLILNTDEYKKNVIEYALEFKNYDLLKYLVDNKYIWFVGEDKNDYLITFRAGTSIKRRTACDFDNLDYKLAEEDKLRRQMISLAIEHNDFDMLSTLHAREIPTLYQAGWGTYRKDEDYWRYYDEEMVLHVANASEQVLDYFSQEFEIEDRLGRTNKFIFPYMNNLLRLLIQNNHAYLEVLLKRCIEHNRKSYDKLKEYIFAAVNKWYERNCFNENDRKIYKGLAEKATMEWLEFYEDKCIINFYSMYLSKVMITNVVRTEEKSKSDRINCLIEELNDLYNKIANIKYEKIDG